VALFEDFVIPPYLLRKFIYNLTVYVLVTLQNCGKRLIASSYPSVRTAQFFFHPTNFHEICYLSIFKKYVEKLYVRVTVHH